jgi:Ran GTPase-activating protein (RanGAP) involved in mRNA processing and transport
MPPSVPVWLEDICQKLINNDTSFQVVELLHPRIDDVFARVLAQALSENNTVTTFILSCYALVDDGAYSIGNVLGCNMFIRKLQLRDLRNAREICTFFKLLQQNTVVEELSLRHCDICPRGAEIVSNFFEQHPRLQEIRITDCNFLENSLDILCQGIKSNVTIQRLYLVNDSINQNQIIGVAQMLSVSCIRELYLGENDFGDEGITIIADGVRASQSLRLLDLRSNMITSSGALALQGMIVSNQYLLSLNLSWNRLGNLGVFCLARGLQQSNCILQKMDLDANGIDATGAKYLASMLRTNNKLKELKLAFNTLRNEGAQHIADALEYNRTLQWLSLRCNEIGNEGAEAFAQKLPLMRGLKELQLSKNNIDQVGILPLVTSLRSNVDLEYLSIEEKVNEPMTREILQLLRLNKAGRRIFRESNGVPTFLWPYVYSRISLEPNILYHFVNERPDAVMVSHD